VAEQPEKSSDAVAESARAAAQTVKAAAKAGKTAAHLATGTAAGGPAGAVIAAAWDAKDVVIKVVIAVSVALIIIITPVIALPRAITNLIFNLFSTEEEPSTTTTQEAYTEYMEIIDEIIQEAHDEALESVKSYIQSTEGIDSDISLNNIVDNAETNAEYDVAYIIACYSAANKNGDGISVSDFEQTLRDAKSNFFEISYETLTEEKTIPVEYPVYTARQVYGTTTPPTAIQTYTGGSLPTTVYTGAAAKLMTVYVQTSTATSSVAITQAEYAPFTYYKQTKSGSQVTGYSAETAYKATGGTVTYTPTVETVTYVKATISSFKQNSIINSFGIDVTAEYSTGSTYGDVIDNMTQNLKQTLYGTTGVSGTSVSLTDQELISYLNSLDCSATRKYILRTAFSLVGKVDYFWGGKSGAGWNDLWGTPKVVTAAGSPSTGTTRPYGLDCSGFTSWVYLTAYGVSIGSGTRGQRANCTRISASEAQPGDLAFLPNSSGDGWNHVLMFAGWKDGQMMFVHCTSGSGVVFNSPSYVSSLVFGRPNSVDFNAAVPVSATATVNDSVESYSGYIEYYAEKYGVSEYVPLIKAVMMQESGGKASDVMQCSACGYNTTGKTITDPEYSINVGIQYLRDCLNSAGVTGADDLDHIKLALQGYNYGGGYITWALKNYGCYTEENAKEFADNQKKKLGWKSYGDTEYVSHVLRYYSVN
jgi:cell wall-associated NlpC family hydrolase